MCDCKGTTGVSDRSNGLSGLGDDVIDDGNAWLRRGTV